MLPPTERVPSKASYCSDVSVTFSEPISYRTDLHAPRALSATPALIRGRPLLFVPPPRYEFTLDEEGS